MEMFVCVLIAADSRVPENHSRPGMQTQTTAFTGHFASPSPPLYDLNLSP